MRRFYTFSFKRKLQLAMAATSLLILGLAATAITSMRATSHQAEQVMDAYLPGIDYVDQADRDLYQALVAERSRLHPDPNGESVAALLKDHDDNVRQARTRVGKFAKLVRDPRAQALVPQFMARLEAWADTSRQVFKLAAENSPQALPAARRLSEGKGQRQFESARSILNQLEDLNNRDARALADDTQTAAIHAQRMVGGVTLISLVLCVVLAVVFPGLVIRPLQQVTRRMNDIASGSGDLTARLEVRSQDELGQMADAFNRFAEKLRDMVQHVASATTQMGAAAEQLSVVAGQTSKTTERQLSETDQLAAAMTEMAASALEVARSAAAAAEATGHADREAASGQHRLHQTMERMQSLATQVDNATTVVRRVHEESQEVDKVLDVIRGVAEQTNLLALNAAIESARAGEAGRGFSVVAGEVRTLAQRTQQSTSEIQVIIERLQSGTHEAVQAMESGHTEAGLTLEQANETLAALEAVMREVSSVNDGNTQIASAAEEQSAVSEDINRNVSTINEIASQTAEGAGQTAQSSREIARLATDLQTMVGQFKT